MLTFSNMVSQKNKKFFHCHTQQDISTM